MEKLPVKLLTELLTPDEMIAAYKVKETHEVHFCPIGISLPDENRVFLEYQADKEQFSEFRYTPRAYFAVKVWETARDNLLKRPEFVGALNIEWYPVAASFNSIRFVNGGTEKFITAMWEEMKRLADSHTVEAAGDFLWKDIKDAFVVLKPIQIAFIAGEKMHRATPLDEEFIDTCGNFDLKKVKELVAEGANIHAVDQNGDTAMSTMMMSYYGNPFGEQLPPDNGNHDNFIKIAQYLLSLGYNINLAGYDAGTCLNDAPHIDMEIVKFLLDNGADPNVGSHIGDNGGEILGRTVLAHVWDDEIAHKEENFDDLERLLLSYGALPIPAGQRITPDELDDWIKEEREKKQWDDSICLGSSNFNDALLNCAGNMNFYYMALIAQSGGDVNVRDARGAQPASNHA